MAQVCQNCGAAVAADARFCASCGTPLEVTPAQRKFATMVFADLVDSTQIAAGLDPEQLRGRLAPFFEVARGTLEEHGGTIEKFIGDAVLGVFGVPRAHGDDPDRAVAASLALVQRLQELDDSLAIRIGVEAGEVLSTGGDGDLAITGEAVNAAARLQQAARPGEILVGKRAAQACRLAQLEPRDPIDAKGLPGPLPAWNAVGAIVEAEGGPRLPLLGREDELELLRLVYRRAAREGAPQLAVITGEAGIGKSRLAGELIRELRGESQPPRVLTGHNPPYGRGIAFWALGEILREAAGASADDPVEAVGAGLERLLSALGADDAGEMAAALVVVLSGANGDGASNVEDVVKRAWKRFVALLTADRPLLVAIDDAHWADDGLLDLLEDAAFGLPEARLVILCTARPELFERRPDFGRAARNVTQVELRPLEEATTADLVRLLLPGHDGGFARKVAEASGGNPFFAEEVARCMPVAAQGAVDLPDTVQAAIAARMDLLPNTEKRTLQYAAVLGEAFLEDRLEDLLGGSPREQLDGLERKALIQEHLATGTGRYAFRHQLIRDVAYATLPRDERANLHERAAADIDSKAGDRIVELAEIVAFHLAQAAELGPSPARSESAHEAALEAALIADRRGAPARAQELYEQAAALALDDADRAAALRTAGETAIYRWRGDHGLRLLRESAEVAERAGLAGVAASAYARAVEAVARMGGVTGELPEPEIQEMMERAKELVPEDDVATRAQLLLDDAWIAWRFDDAAKMGESARRALELARATDDPRLNSSALDAVSADEWQRHRYESCLEHARQRIQLLEAAPRSPGLDIERQDALHMMVESLVQTGSFAEAAEWAAKARDRDLRHGVVYSAWCRTILPWFFLGRWDESLEAAGKFREAWLAEERPPLSAMASAVSAAGAIHGYRGNEGKSRDWFELADGMKAAEGGGQTGGIRLLEADVALHHGQPDLAVEHVKDARGGFWWNTVFLATRAEALAAAGDDRAEEALAVAEEHVFEQPYARAITLRARGQLGDDRELIERSRALFAQLACPYQEARTAWMLGGTERDRALGVFRELGTTVPATVDG